LYISTLESGILEILREVDIGPMRDITSRVIICNQSSIGTIGAFGIISSCYDWRDIFVEFRSIDTYDDRIGHMELLINWRVFFTELIPTHILSPVAVFGVIREISQFKFFTEIKVD
jgi:hypothetical protein